MAAARTAYISDTAISKHTALDRTAIAVFLYAWFVIINTKTKEYEFN